MKKLILDVDDVITGGTFLNAINEFLNTNYKEDEVKNYYIQDLLGEKKDEFFEKFEEIDLYKSAKLYDNCYDVLKRLNEKYDIYPCSAFVWREVPEKSSGNLKNKYDFLYKELPFIDPNKYIFTTSKNIIKADIRIDDKMENLTDANLNILYTAYHNKNINQEELDKNNIIRANNWLEIEEIINNYQ